MSLARSSGPFAPKPKPIPSAFLKPKTPQAVQAGAWDSDWLPPTGVAPDLDVEECAWRLAQLLRDWPESRNPRFHSLQADLSRMIDEMFMAAYHADAKIRRKEIARRMLERFEQAKVLTGNELYQECERVFIKQGKIPKAFRR